MRDVALFLYISLADAMKLSLLYSYVEFFFCIFKGTTNLYMHAFQREYLKGGHWLICFISSHWSLDFLYEHRLYNDSISIWAK